MQGECLGSHPGLSTRRQQVGRLLGAVGRLGTTTEIWRFVGPLIEVKIDLGQTVFLSDVCFFTMPPYWVYVSWGSAFGIFLKTASKLQAAQRSLRGCLRKQSVCSRRLPQIFNGLTPETVFLRRNSNMCHARTSSCTMHSSGA